MLRNILRKVNQNKKKLVIYGSLALAAKTTYDELYCKIYRRIKGLEKIQKNFIVDFKSQKHESLQEQIHLVNQSDCPLLYVYPESNKEVCRLINYCHKYNYTLLVQDSDSPLIQKDYKGCLVVDMCKMQDYSIDTENMNITVGSGMTLEKINTVLEKEGYFIPIAEEYKQYKVYEAVSSNEVSLETANLVNFNQIVNNLEVALTNKLSGEQLLTSPNQFFIFGQQSNHNEMFIGKNNVNGIISHANLRIFKKNQKMNNYTIKCKKNDEISDTDNIQTCFTNFKNQLEVDYNNFDKVHLNYNNNIGQFQIAVDSQFDIKFNDDQSAFTYELNQQTYSGNIKQDNYIQLQIDYTNLKQNYQDLKHIIQKKHSDVKDYNLKYDFKTNNLFIYFNDQKFNDLEEQYKFSMLYDIVNLLQYNDGVFIKYSQDKKLSERLKTFSFPVEFGENNLLYYKQINEILNSQNIIVNNDYIESDLF